MKKLKLWTVVTIILIGLASTVSIGFAWANYHGNWDTQPLQGNHWWYNNNPTLSQLKWDADDLWTAAAITNMQWWRTNFGREFRIEQEAYNPANGGSLCDRFHATSFTSLGLPVQAWNNMNGCGLSTWREELRIEINENALVGSTWYRHRVTYNKAWAGCSSSGGEVNYSFSHNQAPGDSWLGKINYNSCFNKTGSDPAGMVN